MNPKIPLVNPGDPISASHTNRIIEQVNLSMLNVNSFQGKGINVTRPGLGKGGAPGTAELIGLAAKTNDTIPGCTRVNFSSLPTSSRSALDAANEGNLATINPVLEKLGEGDALLYAVILAPDNNVYFMPVYNSSNEGVGVKVYNPSSESILTDKFLLVRDIVDTASENSTGSFKIIDFVRCTEPANP